MKKKIIIDDKTREQIAEFLPRALTATMTSYEKYMSGTMDEAQRKGFEADHKAAKVALAHIELLMKLAGIAEIPSKDGEGMELAALLQQASAELDKYQDQNAYQDGGEDE